MKLRTLHCGSCTAPLEVGAHERQATCEYCDTQTLVGAAPAAADQRPRPLQELDEDWIRQRDQLLRTTRSGALSVPSVVGSVVVGLVMLAFGVFWIVMAINIGAPFPFPLFGVLWMVLVVVGMAKGLHRARRFTSARDHYRGRRRSLLHD